jgi:hypothetical protein
MGGGGGSGRGGGGWAKSGVSLNPPLLPLTRYLFIESICNDERVLEANYLFKLLYSPDYVHCVNKEEVRRDPPSTLSPRPLLFLLISPPLRPLLSRCLVCRLSPTSRLA